MQTVHSLKDAPLSRPSHVTIGAFDGVHRGHRHLIGSMVAAAHEAGRAAVALTFDPHPGALLGRSPVAVLSTIEERAALLESLGVDLLVVLRFTPAVAGTPAARFVAGLCRHLGLVELWAGPDFALGHRREGNVPFLRRLGEREGFVVRVVEPLRWRGEVVSSTRIRAALTAGDIEEANGCLGRPYHLSGTVVRGRGLGCVLGVPTANLEPPSGRLIPANGVYACFARVEAGETWPAVVNVGVRPTIAANHLIVEAHLLDFEGDLYGQRLGLDFIARLRDEETFPSLNALVAQVREDIGRARRILAADVEGGEGEGAE
ncbi:MAG TPA: bifunctional riboflavin kinase/FAD synthetase [Anaerolineales bacterium]|nr:bifunctional riboflavin kinase/FAD synthetase [Anaerolineales bacterium]